ncbi:MAG TPA: 50S ribosomal protein L6 [Alphaproteobacteria bacterium]|nr:50S ribosomal protein L6 [Alphaproteobacteria bacterium]
MSRVGKAPVKIESGVEVKINSGNNVEIKGKKGTLKVQLPEQISIKVEDGNIVFAPLNPERKNDGKVKALWGLSRALVRNMVEGVTNGYTKNLEIEGVGYKAASQGKTLKLDLGFSHDVIYQVPEGIEIKTPKPTEIQISGIDKRLVGQVAAELRAMKKPEPYKGKGIKYAGEKIRRKEGKKK